MESGGIEPPPLRCERSVLPLALRPHETQRVRAWNEDVPDDPVGHPVNLTRKPSEDPADDTLHAKES